MAKLYPPQIESALPAFAGTTLNIPFSPGRLNKLSDITGAEIIIKTVATGKEVITKDGAVANNIATFSVNSNLFNVGQFYKVQLALKSGSGAAAEFGYLSTVGVIKYTSAPTLTIEVNNSGAVVVKGKYTNSDTTEKLKSYKFTILKNGTIVASSGEQIHDINNEYDLFYPNYEFENGVTYSVSFDITTINGYQATKNTTFTYSKSSTSSGTITAVNNVAEGYVDITMSAYTNNLRLLRKHNNQWEELLQTIPNQKHFRDFTVEQGEEYIYGVEIISGGKYGQLSQSDSIKADFEDALIYDGERQLNLRYDCKISSYKSNIQEQKVETIGAQFPFIFRNGAINYKEFSINGLLSYHIDEHRLFQDGCFAAADSADAEKRATTVAYSDSDAEEFVGEEWHKEREFKNAVLDWLSDGKPKLLRTCQEGNFIIRLVNISASPNEVLGRRIHSFSATAYEIAEPTIENLKKYNLIGEAKI